MRSRPSSSRRYLPSSPFNNLRVAEEVEQFAVQEHVHHDRFGLGRVVQVETGSVVVDFGTQHIRIDSPFHKLTKL